MKCAVITPVGPAHSLIFNDAQESIWIAKTLSKGPFEDVYHIRCDDTKGALGRSQARNEGIQAAHEHGCEWLFFLDADDLLDVEAFDKVAGLVEEYDGIWGEIWTMEGRRPGQLWPFTKDMLYTDSPMVTLQMGFFVRTSLMLKEPWDTSIDCTEDFELFFRLWEAGKCCKIPERLFVHRSGMHSQGPRSATGRDWCERMPQTMLNARRSAGRDERTGVLTAG